MTTTGTVRVTSCVVALGMTGPVTKTEVVKVTTCVTGTVSVVVLCMMTGMTGVGGEKLEILELLVNPDEVTLLWPGTLEDAEVTEAEED